MIPITSKEFNSLIWTSKKWESFDHYLEGARITGAGLSRDQGEDAAILYINHPQMGKLAICITSAPAPDQDSKEPVFHWEFAVIDADNLSK